MIAIPVTGLLAEQTAPAVNNIEARRQSVVDLEKYESDGGSYWNGYYDGGRITYLREASKPSLSAEERAALYLASAKEAAALMDSPNSGESARVIYNNGWKPPPIPYSATTRSSCALIAHRRGHRHQLAGFPVDGASHYQLPVFRHSAAGLFH